MLMHEWFIAILGTILLPRGGSRNSSRNTHRRYACMRARMCRRSVHTTKHSLTRNLYTLVCLA